jgi:hypothetical protein
MERVNPVADSCVMTRVQNGTHGNIIVGETLRITVCRPGKDRSCSKHSKAHVCLLKKLCVSIEWIAQPRKARERQGVGQTIDQQVGQVQAQFLEPLPKLRSIATPGASRRLKHPLRTISPERPTVVEHLD